MVSGNMRGALLSVEQAMQRFEAWSDVIDARTPAEFAEDHLPGALNAPVLDNEQRAAVGTLYASSPFEGRRLGAALVARNIAGHLETLCANKDRHWTPLVYCWRGGQRSGAFTHILRQVGWPATQLEGGYKAWRRWMTHDLDTRCEGLQFRVLCGTTGSGKSRLLQALREAGAQVLDLEGLACHRGSVLGHLPDQPQPSQKAFESALWQSLRHIDPSQPIYVESESKKIGKLHIPERLMQQIRAGQCLQLAVPIEARVGLLRSDYSHFEANPALLDARLQALVPLHGHATVEQWRGLWQSGQWDSFVEQLLSHHYDPAYYRSMGRNYRLGEACIIELAALDATTLAAQARAIRVRWG
jgi:tRNA 2-selenouridine synthase